MTIYGNKQIDSCGKSLNPSEKDIGVLNTKTNTLSVLTATSVGYRSAVLAANGNIYLGATDVILFSGVSLIPTLNFCLTPYVNNGANRT